MVVEANWPGATAEEVTNQVTERIEQQDGGAGIARLHQVDHHRRPHHRLRQSAADHQRAKDVQPTWVRVRNLSPTSGTTFRRGYGAVFQRPLRRRLRQYFRFHRRWAEPRQLRDQVEDARKKILTTANVGRVDLIGAQDEVIYLEFSTRQIASLGVDLQKVIKRWPRKTPSPPPASCRPGRNRLPFASAAASRPRTVCGHQPARQRPLFSG